MPKDTCPPMVKALESARLGEGCGEVPIGAVIVHNNTIIASAHNLVETLNDPTAHAEMLVIQEAAKVLGTPRLVACQLYVTLEPCPMCAQAISFARIKTLYYGAYDPKGGGVDHGPKIFKQPTCHHAPEVYGGILEMECGQILKDFFQAKRLEES